MLPFRLVVVALILCLTVQVTSSVASLGCLLAAPTEADLPEQDDTPLPDAQNAAADLTNPQPIDPPTCHPIDADGAPGARLPISHFPVPSFYALEQLRI